MQLAMSLALANGTSINDTQAEAWIVLVYPSLPILAARGMVWPWEEALMTPGDSVPLSTPFACDFEVPHNKRWE